MTNVLITGANRGIGLELTRQYLDRGANVFAAARTPHNAADLAALQKTAPGRLTLVQLDVTDAGDCAALESALGGAPLDILVNNAGIIGPDQQSTLAMDFAGFATTLEVNTLAPLRVIHAVLDQLKAAGDAKILTISSKMGSFSATTQTDRMAYRASKAATNLVMRGLAQDLAETGIAVGVAHPGWVRSDMGGAGADISAKTSADGLISVIDRLTLANTGSFVDWTGQAIGW
ncbi:MAG: SDR family oxidoreductase [Alphaproteobacteria bacterium]